MKKIKTYPNHLEIITSFLIKISQPLQDIMNAWAPVCMCPNARTP